MKQLNRYTYKMLVWMSHMESLEVMIVVVLMNGENIKLLSKYDLLNGIMTSLIDFHHAKIILIYASLQRI